MAQSTILAAGGNRAFSSDIVVAAGAVDTVALFVATGSLTPGCRAIVWIDTPGADNRVIDLDHLTKQTQINGPATYRVERVNAPVDFGVSLET